MGKSLVSCFFDSRCRYQSKVADFNPPHLYLASSQGATPVEFRGDLWRQKTKAPVWFSFCDLAFSRFSSWNTDLWQTQTQTDTGPQHIHTALAQRRAVKSTRSSAIAEGPRDASCQLKSCQLPRNSEETTCTTSPEQIEVMKLEG